MRVDDRLQEGERYRQSIGIYNHALQVLPGGVNSHFRLASNPVPIYWTGGRGSKLFDVDGHEYIDYALGMGPAILGHAPPTVVSAVTNALSRGQTLAGQTRDEVELAELVVQTVPCAEQVRFGSSGSEMAQLALRLARAVTGRRLVVKFEGHYHGWFDNVLVSNHPSLEAAGPYEDPITVLESAGQSRAAAEETRVLPWNDLAAVERYLDTYGGETAAIIMEPILCNTGVVVPRPGYLEGVRRVCDRHSVVLVFDEVITGFRVSLGGAQRLLGVTPDLCILAKALGGGFPIAALAGKRDLMDLTANSVIQGGTYNANLASTAAGLATLRTLIADDGAVYERLEKIGGQLLAGLRELTTGSDLGLRVEGLSTVFNTAFLAEGDITDYRSYAKADSRRQRRFLDELQRRGVRVTSRGTWFVSTTHSTDDVNTTLDAASATLDSIR